MDYSLQFPVFCWVTDAEQILHLPRILEQYIYSKVLYITKAAAAHLREDKNDIFTKYLIFYLLEIFPRVCNILDSLVLVNIGTQRSQRQNTSKYSAIYIH